MLVRKFRFFVLPPGETFPWRGPGAHQVDVHLGLLDASETVWVDGVIVHSETSMKLSNEIPVMVGSKSGVVKVSTGWHLMGRARLFIDGRSIDPAPKGKTLPDVPDGEARPTTSIGRWRVVGVGVCAGVGAGIQGVLMKARPVVQLTAIAILTVVLVAALAWARARHRRRK